MKEERMSRMIYKHTKGDRLKGLLLAVFLLLAAWPASGATVTLDECLALAMEYHPALEEARAALDAERSRLRAVEAATAFSGGISASTSKQTGADQSWSASFTVTKLLSDSGKNALERKSRRLAIDSSVESQREAMLSVRRGVKDAYHYLALQQLKLEQVVTAVGTYERHLERARGFYEAGAKAKFDVTKAEVDLSSARIALLSAKGDLARAGASLSNSVGAELGDVEVLTDFPSPLDLPEETFALEQALENRPDVRIARMRQESGELSVSLAAKGDAATISLSGSASLSGRDWPLDDSFRASVALSAPLFDGGLTDARVEESRHALRGAEAAVERAVQSAVHDVRTSLLSAREAEARIPAAELQMRQAEENLALAEGRYETGVGSALEVADALLAFERAKAGVHQARHDYAAALVALEKSLGGEFQ